MAVLAPGAKWRCCRERTGRSGIREAAGADSFLSFRTHTHLERKRTLTDRRTVWHAGQGNRCACRFLPRVLRLNRRRYNTAEGSAVNPEFAVIYSDGRPDDPRSHGNISVGAFACRFICSTIFAPAPGARRTVTLDASSGTFLPSTVAAVNWCS